MDADQKWMEGKDSADNEYEETGALTISGDTKWQAIRRQLRGLITILRRTDFK